MRGMLFSFSNRFPILLFGLLISAYVSSAQRVSTREVSTVQLPDAPSQVASVSEHQIGLHLTSKGLSFPIQQNQSQAAPWMRFFTDLTSYNPLLFYGVGILNQGNIAAAELQGKHKFFSDQVATTSMTFAPNFGHALPEARPTANTLEYWGHRIPWAGNVILRVDQQARAHPHITNALKTVRPSF